MNNTLRIAVAAKGRFHLLDVARELSALGHDVKFYSLVPKARSTQFGLPKECHVSLLPLMAPIAAWELFFPKLLSPVPRALFDIGFEQSSDREAATM